MTITPETCQHPVTRLVLVDDAPRPVAFCPDCGVQLQVPPCFHRAERLWAWWARDDTAPGGRVLVVICLDCGAVLAGAAPG